MNDDNQQADAPSAPAAWTTTAAAAVTPAKRELAATAPPASKRAHMQAEDDVLRVQRTSQDARLPKPGSALSAGYDLFATSEATLPPAGRAVIKIGLKMAVPQGCYGRVAPRYDLAVKAGIDVGAGVIDADYRGEIGVVLFNFGADPFTVKIGDRIAQLILEKICMANVIEVQSLDSTDRGEGGFGSTGVQSS